MRVAATLGVAGQTAVVPNDKRPPEMADLTMIRASLPKAWHGSTPSAKPGLGGSFHSSHVDSQT